MDTNQKAVVELLSLAIQNKKAAPGFLQLIDWTAVLELAKKHAIEPLIYTAVNSDYIDKNIYQELRVSLYSQLANKIRNEELLAGVIDEFHRRGIKLIALKGLVLEALYPVPETRTMSDVDLLVREVDYEAGIKLLKSLGFEKEGIGKEVHITMVYKSMIRLELHKKLFDDNRFELPSDYLEDLWSRSVPVSICNRNILTLSYDDTMLYLLLHLAGHYREGGFGLRMLCDIALYLENMRPHIDWGRLYSSAERLGVLRFTTIVFMSCNSLFGIQIPENTAGKIIISKDQSESFVQDIFDAGAFGKSTVTRHMTNKIISKVGLSEYKGIGKLAAFIKFIFPMPGKLGENYLYARRNPAFLPIAWIHRWIYNIFDSRQREMMKIYLRQESESEISEILINRRKLVSWLMNETKDYHSGQGEGS